MAFELKVMSMARALARHAESRQTLISENIANADTREFRARDVKPFSEVYAGPGAAEGSPHSLPRAGFGMMGALTPGAGPARDDVGRAYEITRFGADLPSGNSVSLEDQMVRGAEAMADHQLSLGIMRKTMDLMRMVITKA